MTNIMHGAAIKRAIFVFLLIATLLVLFTGCGTAENETPGTEDEAPAQAADETDDQTVEVSAAVPADLLSDGMNVFSGVAFPEGYTVFAAGFENNVDFFFYDLYLTAAGDPQEIITYISNLLGDSSEESIQQNIDYYTSEGGVGVDGRMDEIGLDVNCKITPTEETYYDYDYVAGCSLRLRASIDDPSSYEKIIEENYNLNSLSEVANYFSVTPITGKSEIYVLKNHNNAQLNAVYNTVDDVAGVMESMKASLTNEGFDEAYTTMNLTVYGEVSNRIYFDVDNNSICVFQCLSDSGKNYKDYQLATTGLTALGFTSYIESDALCEYRDEANSQSIAINIPEWGSRPNAWENSCVQFLKGINGYLLAIWYYPDQGRYVVQADKDETSAKYEYYTATGEFSEEYPDPDAVQAQFGDMYSGFDVEDVYTESIELFQGCVSDTFGMSIDELYALAASE